MTDMSEILSELPLLGPVEGFYPVVGFKGEHTQQLWIPKGLQDYEAFCLAKIVQDSGYNPTHVISIARGGLATAQAVLYANEIRSTLGYQTYGYDKNDNPLENPIIISRPDFTGIRKRDRKGPMRLLITDELLDAGKSIRLVKNDAITELEPDEVRTAVIYVKDRDHVSDADYCVRTVQNVWLDHETLASDARRNIRLKQLEPHAKEIAEAMGKLAVLPASMQTLEAILLYSAQYHADLK